MRKHITDVKEFSEAGILLQIRGEHVVRVLGALKEAPVPELRPTKEQWAARTDQAVYDQYYSGALAGEQDDPEEQPYHPVVPSLFITRKGEVVFLKRDAS